MKPKHVYGPVPSRRFGLSLGVDLVPYKTCSLDCTYCQLGVTTELSVEREDFSPPGQILTDVEQALQNGPRPDVITLAGSGEPTLYKSLGRLIQGLRDLTDIPIMLLTNGTLLYNDLVTRDAMLVDILSPSLDAGDQQSFKAINRPHASLQFQTVLQGLRSICEKHPGTIHLEVMLVGGSNDSDQSISQLAGILSSIRAHTVDINNPVRPAACPKTLACSSETLHKALSAFGSKARIVASFSSKQNPQQERPVVEQEILELLARRPCTVEDIHISLGFHPHQVVKALENAVNDKKALTRVVGDRTYYFTSGDQPRTSSNSL